MYRCNKCKRVLKTSSSFIKHKESCKLNLKLIYNIRYDYVYNELSTNEISKKYGVDRTALKYILKDFMRDLKTSLELYNSKEKDPYKHTEETKQFLRDFRLKWLRENSTFDLNYLNSEEKTFKNVIESAKWDKTFLIIKDKIVIYEYQPYHICFAFDNQKIAIELDESIDEELGCVSHLIDDYKKVKIEEMEKEGWKVFRYTPSDLEDYVKIVEELEKEFDSNLETSEIGIVIEKAQSEIIKERNSIEKDMYGGLTKKKLLYHYKRRKIDRPDYESLKKDLEELKYKGVAEKYGVSTNTIFRWVKWYEKTEKR